MNAPTRPAGFTDAVEAIKRSDGDDYTFLQDEQGPWPGTADALAEIEEQATAVMNVAHPIIQAAIITEVAAWVAAHPKSATPEAIARGIVHHFGESPS